MSKLSFCCLLIYTIIHSQIWGIISFENASDQEFDLNKHPRTRYYIESYDKNNYERVKHSKKPVIPKIIHHIWVGGELPKKFLKLVNSWKEQHPDWQHILWTDNEAKTFNFVNRKQFEGATNMGAKSDIWRYEILYRYGGVYLDIDYECLKSLDPLHHTSEFYATCPCGDGMIGNGVIGSVPRHPIILECIRKISRLRAQSLTNPWNTTGPLLLNNCIIRFLKRNRLKDHKIAIYPSKFFHPLPFDFSYDFWSKGLDRNIVEKYILPESFGIHYWANSWK